MRMHCQHFSSALVCRCLLCYCLTQTVDYLISINCVLKSQRRSAAIIFLYRIMSHLTREEVLASGTISPTYKKASEARPVDISGTDITAWRTSRAEHLQKLRHLYPISGPIPNHVTETLHEVPTRDAKSIRVKVYQPVIGLPEGGSCPLIMMYHEGGWMMGDLTDEDLNCRMFARDLGAVCVNVEYRSVS